LRGGSHRLHHTFAQRRVELAQIERERNEKLLTVPQPVDQNLGRDDVDEGTLELRRADA
jgi:hypothetical protein